MILLQIRVDFSEPTTQIELMMYLFQVESVIQMTMEQDMMTMACTVENAGDGCITDPINTLSALGETDKGDVMQTSQTAYLITDSNGLVLLETQRG